MLTFDQCVQMAQLWNNVANLPNVRMAAPVTLSDEVFTAAVNEAWQAMQAVAGEEPPA